MFMISIAYIIDNYFYTKLAVMYNNIAFNQTEPVATDDFSISIFWIQNI